MFLQNQICTPPDDHTIALCRQFFDQLFLLYQNLNRLMPDVVGLIFVQVFLLCDHVNNLLVLAWNPQCIRESLSKLTSSAAELSTDCNNSHNFPPVIFLL